MVKIPTVKTEIVKTPMGHNCNGQNPISLYTTIMAMSVKTPQLKKARHILPYCGWSFDHWGFDSDFIQSGRVQVYAALLPSGLYIIYFYLVHCLVVVYDK